MIDKEIDVRNDHGCIIPLLEKDEVALKLQNAFQAEVEREGRVRNLTRAVAASSTTWQAATRALHLFATLKRVDPRTCALLCLYTSMLNGCYYCIDDAAGEALERGVTLEQMLSLPNASASILGDKVFAMLRFAECMVLNPTRIPNEIILGLKAHVDNEELLEMSAIIAMKCFWNCFASTLRIPPEGRCGDSATFRILCEFSDMIRQQTVP